MHTKRVGIKLNDCEHGKSRSQCTEGCGGGSISQHSIQRSQCREGCGGGSYCLHGKRRSLCREGCGGGSYCEHGKPRAWCKLGCGGGAYCEHGKVRSRCKQEGCGKQPSAAALLLTVPAQMTEPIDADARWLRPELNIETLETAAPVEILWGGEWWYFSSVLSLGPFGDVFSCVPIAG